MTRRAPRLLPRRHSPGDQSRQNEWPRGERRHRRCPDQVPAGEPRRKARGVAREFRRTAGNIRAQSMTDQSTTRTFGPTRRRVAAIGQGSWKIEESAADSAVLSLRRGLDLGLTHIDTAEMYGSGAAEIIIANAIAGRRDEAFLVSKGLPTNASPRVTPAARGKSLARLRTHSLH